MWPTILLKVLSQVPVIVVAIETIVKGAKQGATKKELALQSLGIANAVAQANLSDEHKAAAEAATTLVATAIDNTVTLLNAAGVLKPSQQAATAGTK